VLITIRVGRPYKKKLAHLNTLIKKVEKVEPLGDYETMRRWKKD
jgi:hypothetical protein